LNSSILVTIKVSLIW